MWNRIFNLIARFWNRIHILLISKSIAIDQFSFFIFFCWKIRYKSVKINFRIHMFSVCHRVSSILQKRCYIKMLVIFIENPFVLLTKTALNIPTMGDY